MNDQISSSHSPAATLDFETDAPPVRPVDAPGSESTGNPAAFAPTSRLPDTPVPPPKQPPGPARPDGSAGPAVLTPRFVGTGGDYFGIWIVNLLLLIVTLGIYFPWARVRKLQFFAGNTDVGGHRLQFTGVARQMFLGFSLAMVAFIAYYASEAFAPALSLTIIVAFALVWPWLFRAALRFRLAKTQWRGLPFAFTGSTGGAYKMLLPLYILAIAAAVLGGGASLFGASSLDSDSPMVLFLSSFAGLAVLGVLMIGPWVQYRIKRYQHEHYRFADRQSKFTAGVGSFYLLFLKTFGVFLATLFAVGAVSVLMATVFGAASIGEFADLTELEDTFEESPVLIAGGLFLTFLGVFLAWQAVTAYFVRTLHNITWGHTAGNGFAFAANLKFWPFFGLRVLNLVLKSLTLGLYTPFAQVAIVKMKLDSVVLAVDFDLEELVVQAQQGKVSAGADAAADLFDLDIAL